VRIRFDARKYAVNANKFTKASTSPRRLALDVPVEPSTTSAVPTRASPAQPSARRRTGSPKSGPATSRTRIGWSAPMIVTFATLVSFTAVKKST
jgi:hypothetical protein